MKFRYGNVPLIGDYLNERALSHHESEPLIVGLVGFVGAFAGCLGSATTALSTLIPEQDQAASARAMLAICLFAVTLYVLTAREVTYDEETRSKVVRYVCANRTRTICKIVLPLVGYLVVWRVLEVSPNVLTGRRHIMGYLCSTDGQAIHEGSLDVVDIGGSTVARRRELLDSDGFFVVDLKPWSRAPDAIRVQSSECRSELGVPIREGRTELNSCREANLDLRPNKSELQQWIVKCDRSDALLPQ